jgi:cytochrome c
MHAMKIAAVGLAAALLFVAPAAFADAPAHNTLTPAEQAAGWKLLFDGRTLNGWREFKKTTIGPGWQVVDGAITLVDPAKADDIITTDQYADFELDFDWKIAKNGNSGVYYHVIEAGEYGYQSGPEYQLLDNAHGEPPLQRAGGLFGLYAPSQDVTRPIGEYNHSRLIVDHGHVQHWMNGVMIAEYQIGSPDFKARVAGSKFRAWPLFATGRTGYISLQDHESVVAFRDIKIKPLD